MEVSVPNHTDNRVVLSHDKRQMIDMICNIMDDKETPLCQTLIPMPNKLEDTNPMNEKPNWYDWRLEHWGTKWDIYDASYQRIGDKTLALYFHTAWSPPFRIFDKLADMGFEFTARYLDEGWFYIGEYNSWGNHVHFNNVDDVIKEYPELDYEFFISDTVYEMEKSNAS
jgi:hypothetical protein